MPSIQPSCCEKSCYSSNFQYLLYVTKYAGQQYLSIYLCITVRLMSQFPRFKLGVSTQVTRNPRRSTSFFQAYNRTAIQQILNYDSPKYWFFYKWFHRSEVKLPLRLVEGQIFFALQLYDGTMEENQMAQAKH